MSGGDGVSEPIVTMAGIVAEHDGIEISSCLGGQFKAECVGCEWSQVYVDRPNEPVVYATHVAEKLGEAGFGSLTDVRPEMEVKAEALREAADALRSDAPLERPQAWLRRRAEAIAPEPDYDFGEPSPVVISASYARLGGLGERGPVERPDSSALD